MPNERQIKNLKMMIKGLKWANPSDDNPLLIKMEARLASIQPRDVTKMATSDVPISEVPF